MQHDTRIAFIGLGAMGSGMAASLCRAGFAVAGHDVRPDAMDRLAELGGARAATPAEAAQDARLLFVMVVNRSPVDPKPPAAAMPCKALSAIRSTSAARLLAGGTDERTGVLLPRRGGVARPQGSG